MVKDTGHSITGRVIPKIQKMVHDATLLNTPYKVQIKGKLNNPGKGLAPPLHLSVVAIENGAFGLPSAKFGKLTNFLNVPNPSASVRIP